jgi:alpha/beta superfamily hydrolase
MDRSVPPVERLTVHVPDGVELEAEVDVPDGARASVLLAHPHPLYGGSMRGGAPAALFDDLPSRGIAALRFNFRGVEGSTGTHDRGIDERHDVAAAVDELARRAPGLPIVVCGWSFGGDVSLCIVDDRIAGWCPIAPPLAVVAIESMGAATDARPKHILVPEHDQYSPPERTATTTADWTATEIEVLPMTDHFLGGALAFVCESVAAFVDSVS